MIQKIKLIKEKLKILFQCLNCKFATFFNYFELKEIIYLFIVIKILKDIKRGCAYINIENENSKLYSNNFLYYINLQKIFI
jgi:hypothetical protein